MAIKPYNGHHCWNCWNVSLWIGNDEFLYRLARHHWKRANHVDTRAKVGVVTRWLLQDLPAKTPDGAKYTDKSVRAAVKGLFEE